MKKKLGQQPTKDSVDESVEPKAHEMHEEEEKKRMKAVMIRMLKLAGDKGKKE